MALRRKRPEQDVVDLRTDETIDLRSDPAPPVREYHVMRVWHNVPPDPVADAWAQSASLVEYPPDLDDVSHDRWRDALEPGPQSATVLSADELTPGEPT